MPPIRVPQGFGAVSGGGITNPTLQPVPPPGPGFGGLNSGRWHPPALQGFSQGGVTEWGNSEADLENSDEDEEAKPAPKAKAAKGKAKSMKKVSGKYAAPPDDDGDDDDDPDSLKGYASNAGAGKV